MNEHYHLGYNAFCEGKKANKCPYNEGTQQAIDWHTGWQKAEKISNTPIGKVTPSDPMAELATMVFNLYYEQGLGPFAKRFVTVSVMMDQALADGLISYSEWLEWEKQTVLRKLDSKYNASIRRYGKIIINKEPPCPDPSHPTT